MTKRATSFVEEPHSPQHAIVETFQPCGTVDVSSMGKSITVDLKAVDTRVPTPWAEARQECSEAGLGLRDIANAVASTDPVTGEDCTPLCSPTVSTGGWDLPPCSLAVGSGWNLELAEDTPSALKHEDASSSRKLWRPSWSSTRRLQKTPSAQTEHEQLSAEEESTCVEAFDDDSLDDIDSIPGCVDQNNEDASWYADGRPDTPSPTSPTVEEEQEFQQHRHQLLSQYLLEHKQKMQQEQRARQLELLRQQMPQSEDRLPGDFREIVDFLSHLKDDKSEDVHDNVEQGRDSESYDEALQGNCRDRVRRSSTRGVEGFFKFAEWKSKVCGMSKVDRPTSVEWPRLGGIARPAKGRLPIDDAWRGIERHHATVALCA